MSTTHSPAQSAATDHDTFAQADRMATVAQKLLLAKRQSQTGQDVDGITREDLPDLFGYLVTLGVMSGAQARALADAFASGDLGGLPTIPSHGKEFFYDAFLAARAERAADTADDVVDEIVAAVEWIVAHAPVIVAAAEAIAQAASDFWHWLTD